MKLKSKYIVLFILIILIMTILLIFKSNNIKINEIFNIDKSKSSIKTHSKLLAINNNYQIKLMNNSTCSIEWDMNDADGFEGAYFKIGGNKHPLDYYIDNCGCGNNLKDFIAKGQKDIYELKCGTIVKDNTCNPKETTDSYGNKRYTYYFDGLVRGENCSSWKSDDTEQDGSDSIGSYYYYKGNENNAKCYYSYSSETTGKMCNYVFDTEKKWNLYLVNGCAYDLSSYLTHCNSINENKCGDQNFKNFLIDGMNKNNWISNHIDIYNNNCSDKINYGTVVVYQNDEATGISCDKNGWEWNDSVSCKRSATTGTIAGPNIDNMTKYGTRKFIGWSTDKNCNTIEITSNNFNMNFTGTKTYYACYESTSTTSTLFQNNNKKTIDIKYVNENEYCSDTDTKVTNSYYKKSTEVEPYKSNLVDNPYCNVVCEDDIKVSYPSIFETVPAGQYFELMYEPEITATRTCTSEFNYDKWREDYNNAVNAEIAAMNELNKAKAYKLAADNLPTNSTCCGCCNPGPESTCSPSYGTYGSKTEYYYSAISYSKSNQTTASYNTCSGNTKSGIQSSAQNALNAAKNAYKNAVNKRIKLEQNNLQCYTILDQDNNDKKYSDVFKENYEYTNNLKVNETEYKLKAQKIEVSSTNNSTSLIYTSYIGKTENGGISSVALKQTNNTSIGTTEKFYALYPKLTFKYDNGSNGKPKDLDYILNKTEKEEDILMPESHVKLDTGSFTTNTYGSYVKDATTTNNNGISTLSKNFYVDGSRGNHINFNAYTAKTTTRQVQYYFTYREPKEYYSKKYNGAATIIKPTGEAYISLTKKEKLTDKNNNITGVKNHIYPVEIKAVEGNYYNGILLSNYQNMTISNTTSNTYFTTTNFGSGFKGIYACDYKITNDALKLSKEKQNYKDLKSNTIFRSVATENIDPNGRADHGNLGENWLNAKGSAVREIIKNKETHDGVTKDTYNPKNLEYSFTLTPKIIKAIKGTNNPNGYNALTNYDDFNLICTEDGRECISVFLTYLSDGKIINPNSIHFNSSGKIDNHSSLSVLDTYSNYSSINNWNSDDLDNTRKKWKYYIGDSSITGCTKQLNTNIAICKPNIINLEAYNNLYETWGVLP